jgi:UDP-N-acetylglucosamine:LPS N-acetylglucosamine transferase
MPRKAILIMAGGTGGHIFGSDLTRAALALVSTENVPNEEACHAC